MQPIRALYTLLHRPTRLLKTRNDAKEALFLFLPLARLQPGDFVFIFGLKIGSGLMDDFRNWKESELLGTLNKPRKYKRIFLGFPVSFAYNYILPE